MRQLPFKRLATAIGFFALFCIGILLMDAGNLLDPLRSGLGEVLNPTITRLQAIGRPAPPSEPLEVQLATAQAEIADLRAENMLLQGQLDEFAVIEQTMQIQSDYTDRQTLPARVLGTDPNGLQQTLQINRGSADGVREGMAVIDHQKIFVGQIITVEEHRSTVLMITDSNASVGARMYESRADGIIYGNGRLSPYLTLKRINRAVNPVQNEWVMTSDLFESETARVPGNIPIGFIVGDPIVNAQTDQLEFTVQPEFDRDNLENVWIVVPHD